MRLRSRISLPSSIGKLPRGNYKAAAGASPRLREIDCRSNAACATDKLRPGIFHRAVADLAGHLRDAELQALCCVIAFLKKFE